MKPVSDWENWVSQFPSRIGRADERTFRCVPCRDTGFELTRKMGPYGTEVNVAVVCICSEGQARQEAQRRREAEKHSPSRGPRQPRLDPDADGRYGD